MPKKRTHKIKLSKDLKWLTPYMESVEKIVPIDRLAEIKVTKFTAALPIHDAIIEDKGRGGFKIIVRAYQPMAKRIPISKLDQDTIIQNLAHELSHTVVWEEHDPNRVIVQAQILTAFAFKLKELGYEKDRNKIKKDPK